MSREGLIPQLQNRGIQVTEMKYGQHSVSVYQGIFQNYAVAVKVLALTPDTDHTQLEKECQTLSSLSHSNILRLYGCFWENNGVSDFFVIVTEWCEKDLAKDMKDRIGSQYPWDEADLWVLTHQLVDALYYMQDLGIAHRDIKPENIFLTSEKSAKLGDLGSARAFLSDIDYSTLTGTPFYLSPKLRQALVNQDPHVVHNSFKSDVYSLGLTLLSLALLGPPLSLAKTNLSNEDVRVVIYAIPYSDLFKSMLSGMLIIEENDRSDFRALHAWLENSIPNPNPQVKISEETPDLYQKSSIPQNYQALSDPSRLSQGGYNVYCLLCYNPIDRYSEVAICEVVQLYCEPATHMFCSRGCFRHFLSFGNFRCPICAIDIPKETLDFYLTPFETNNAYSTPHAGATVVPMATNDLGSPPYHNQGQGKGNMRVAERKDSKKLQSGCCICM